MSELSKYVVDTYTFKMRLPNGDVSEEDTITVRGEDHPARKEANRAVILKTSQQRAQNIAQGKKPEAAIDEDDLRFMEEMALERTLALVESIDGVTEGGKPVGKDRDMIRLVLQKYTFLTEQIQGEALNANNFCGK
jgi:hypothetical protein